MCQLLKRLKVSRKRARHHVHSPDPDYVEKLRSVKMHVGECLLDPERLVFLFEDEFTFYRHPSLASAYERMGKIQPLAELGWKSNYFWRIGASLNLLDGRVIYEQGSRLDVPKLVKLYQKVAANYPNAQTIFMVMDNWPVHFHPDLLAALQPQSFPYGIHRPRNWPDTPRVKAKRLNLPFQILCLPTYASWTNPIEKLWRMLNQEVLHLHRFGDDWAGTKQAVMTFLDDLAGGSKNLLRYVGLIDPTKLYQALFPVQFP
jgi:hypothetical protein